jgi:hypothetical protein
MPLELLCGGALVGASEPLEAVRAVFTLVLVRIFPRTGESTEVFNPAVVLLLVLILIKEQSEIEDSLGSIQRRDA